MRGYETPLTPISRAGATGTATQTAGGESPRPTQTPEPLLLTPEEAARVLRIGRTRLYALLADATIASVRIGHSRRITIRALQDFVGRLEEDRPISPADTIGTPTASAPPVTEPCENCVGQRRPDKPRVASTASAIEVLPLPFSTEPAPDGLRTSGRHLVSDAPETT